MIEVIFYWVAVNSLNLGITWSDLSHCSVERSDFFVGRSDVGSEIAGYQENIRLLYTSQVDALVLQWHLRKLL